MFIVMSSQSLDNLVPKVSLLAPTRAGGSRAEGAILGTQFRRRKQRRLRIVKVGIAKFFFFFLETSDQFINHCHSCNETFLE